jgi:hypothetical protein
MRTSVIHGSIMGSPPAPNSTRFDQQKVNPTPTSPFRPGNTRPTQPESSPHPERDEANERHPVVVVPATVVAVPEAVVAVAPPTVVEVLVFVLLELQAAVVIAAARNIADAASRTRIGAPSGLD